MLVKNLLPGLKKKFQPRGEQTHSSETGQGPHTHKESNKHSIFQTIGILLLAPIMAFFLTAFVFQSYQVDGPSMEYALQNNDRLIIYKLPRTWAKITGRSYIPRRGDVVVFTKHDLAQYENADGDRQLIKRVIGLPGERAGFENQ